MVTVTDKDIKMFSLLQSIFANLPMLQLKKIHRLPLIVHHSPFIFRSEVFRSIDDQKVDDAVLKIKMLLLPVN